MDRKLRKGRVGRVVSTKMDKTVLVAVQWQKRHPLYRKSLRMTTKFFAHDERAECRLGDLVQIRESRPLSRMKRWRVESILERHEVAEVKPIELDEGILTEEAVAAEQQAAEAMAAEESPAAADEPITAEEEPEVAEETPETAEAPEAVEEQEATTKTEAPEAEELSKPKRTRKRKQPEEPKGQEE